MENDKKNIIISPLDLKNNEDKEWAKRYLDLEEQRNKNLDKIEEINKKLATLYSDLEK